jgi:hypothetical protein
MFQTVRHTNADKRHCVQIALREFPELSSRAISELCGVGHHLVDCIRPKELADSASSKRTGLDGKQRPAHTQPFSARSIFQQSELGVLPRQKKRGTATNRAAKKRVIRFLSGQPERPRREPPSLVKNHSEGWAV